MDTSTPQIFTPEEWLRNNQRRYNQSDNTRAEWFRILQQSKQLCKEKASLTQGTQDAVTERLSEKARETFDWKKELEKTIEELAREIQKLILQRKRLANSLDMVQLCLIIATECLDLRQQRLSSDIVEDNVQIALLNEVDQIKTFQNLLNKAASEADNQIRTDHAAKASLEKDWSDKWETYRIDTTCGHMMNTSSEMIAFHTGPEKIPAKWSTPEQWVAFTKENITMARNDMADSTSLSVTIDNLLKEAAQELRHQADVVELAYARRIHELDDTFFRLKQHLDLVIQNIVEAEKTINDLRRAILEKEAPLKKAQTRLHMRNQRPNVELCRDPAHYGLIEETRQLAATVQALQEQLSRAEASLSNLLETRRDLEREIAIKENSLSIDKIRCTPVRQRFPPRHKLLGY